MKQWISLSEGLARPGLRLALVRAGIPSPWSEFCRAIFRVKQIDYEQIDGRDAVTGLALLKTTTAQESMPVAFWNNERPRTNWLELLPYPRSICRGPHSPPSSARYRRISVRCRIPGGPFTAGSPRTHRRQP